MAAVVVLVEPGHAGETAIDQAALDAVDEAALRAWVAERLRSTRAPAHIEFRPELPYSETGKLLRRVLKAELGAEDTPAPTPTPKRRSARQQQRRRPHQTPPPPLPRSQFTRPSSRGPVHAAAPQGFAVS